MPGISRTLVIASAALVLVGLSGCTALTPTVPFVSSVSPSASPVSSAASKLGHGPASLSCSQASDGTFPELDSALGGRVKLDLLSSAALSTVPLARDVQLIVPEGQDWLFRKSPIVIAAGTETVTVSVPDDGQQFLAWVPYSVWTNGSPPDLTEWSQTSITFQPCTDQAAAFLGGVLALEKDRCFTLSFQTENGPSDDRHVRLDGQACEQ